VTGMVTGEINRRDGLADLVVGVTTPGGAKVLVFEGPEGALKSKPETLSMPADVTSLALGQLADGFEMDLAIAAGREVLIVRGRDRRLSLDEIRQGEVEGPRITARSFQYPIRSIAVGDFTGNQSTDLAVLSEEGDVRLLTQGRTSNQSAGKPISEWKSKQLTGGRRSGTSQLVCARVSSVPIDSVVAVDAASQSLNIVTDEAEAWRSREGGTVAAAAYRGVSIGLGLEEAPVAMLPMHLNGDALNDLVLLGSRQGGPIVILSQAQSVFTVDTNFDSGPGSLRQAIINANNNPGPDQISFAFGMVIAPLTALPTLTEAVFISGATPFGRVELDGRNFALQPVTGVDGLKISGGTTAILDMVIYSFGDDCIELANNGFNVIAGNLLGTDATGSVAKGSGGAGVFINGSPGNEIGGTAQTARNIISGNSVGIEVFDADATRNLIQGNFIGVDKSGNRELRNFTGVRLIDAPNNTIGGTTAGARNVISGNTSGGVALTGAKSIQNLVQGNIIGSNASGSAPLQTGFSFSQRSGVSCASPSNTIGGTTAAARNVISANGSGVIAGSAQILVQGNFIGTNASGGTALGNATCGVSLFSSNSTIGGASAAARNVISGNGAGVSMSFSGSTNQVQNNFIGTNAAGNAPIGNARSGVFVGGLNNLIGGSTATGNTIAFNGGCGVLVGFRSGTAILGNSIFTNTELGITTAAGANNDNSPPVLLSVSRSGSNATLRGLLNGTPNTTFRVEFFSNTSCDPSGYGEGERFLGFNSVTTDAKGNVTFAALLQLAQGQRISATATDPQGNTSEFSNCIEGNALGADPYIRMATPGVSGVQTASLLTYTITVRNGGSEAATGVTVNDVVPPGAVFIFVETEQGSVSSPVFLGSGTVSVSIGLMNPGASVKIKLTLKVTAAAPPDDFSPIPLTNTATVTSNSLDSNQSNNSALVRTQVIGGFGAADLSATSSSQGNSVAAGTRQSYTVTVRNAGPDTASNVAVVDVIPAGTTFASIAGGLGGCTTPPVGRDGLIVCRMGTFSPGFSVTLTFVVNVLQSPGSNVVNNVTTFADFLFPDSGDVCAEGVPLQVPNGSADPNSSNNTEDSSTPVQGGSILTLSWEQPTLNPGGPAAARNAAPSNLQVQRAGAAVNELALRRIVLLEDADSCFLLRVNIYKSDLAGVQPIPDNLWKSVPPEQLQATMAAAPAGSFYVLTNLWNCGGMEIESGRSNEAGSSSGGNTGPRISNVEKVGKHLIITGTNFVPGSKLIIDGNQKKTVFESVTQLKGKKLGKTTSRGAKVKVRNPDGSLSNEWIY
jgi:uncharacterized repeat protein (TIGR01451 family)